MVRKTTYHHTSANDCPYCDNVYIRCSDVAILHLIRTFLGSKKRYCPQCRKKWMIKTRSRSRAYFETFIVLVATLVGFSVFYTISHFSHESVRLDFFNKDKIISDAAESLNSDQGQEVAQMIQNKLSSDSYYQLMLGKNKAKVQNALGSYTQKYQGSSKDVKKKMVNQARSLMKKYENSSYEEKRRFIEDARRNLRQMNV